MSYWVHLCGFFLISLSTTAIWASKAGAAVWTFECSGRLCKRESFSFPFHTPENCPSCKSLSWWHWTLLWGCHWKHRQTKQIYLGGSGELWPRSKPLRDNAWGARWSSSYIYAQVANGSMCWLWRPVGNRVIWWFHIQTHQPNTNCILVFTQAMANVTMRTVSSDVRHSGGHCYLQILVN